MSKFNGKKFTETRTTDGVYVPVKRHLFFSGYGNPRKDKNDGQPDILRAGTRAKRIDGRVYENDFPENPGTVKVTPIKGAPGWYSLRGRFGTVYLRDWSIVILDGVEGTVAELAE